MKYISLDILTHKDLHQLILDYKTHLPNVMCFDTETDGLNIRHNKPFLISFGFITNDSQEIYTYTLDYEHAPKQLQVDTMYVLRHMIKHAKETIGHNITFDLHMQDNINYPLIDIGNFVDTQIYIRLAHDAIIKKEGGPPMTLKGYAYRYIDKNARSFENKLKEEITSKRRKATIHLKNKLHGKPVPDAFKVSGKEKHWTMAMINGFFKDSFNDIEDLPEDIAVVVQEWLDETPDADNYKLLNRENIKEYAHYDIIYPLLIRNNLAPIIKERKQEEVFQLEVDLIPALYTLEKTGVNFNLDYALEGKRKVKTYVRQLRKEFKELIGEDIGVNQHEEIKKAMFNNFDINLSSTGAEIIEKASKMDLPERVLKIFKIISELRTFEKWYPTYLLKWIKQAQQYGSIVYPTYHATGAVTGRVSSDFQQFPKDALTTIDGEELFHPRGMFNTRKTFKTFFFDYAAMEMRLLAIYTLLVSDGDRNLCRIFIPHECHKKDGTWYLNEDPDTKWSPVDPHALTAINAFGLKGDEDDFGHWRTLGKRGNFAIIYGATGKRLASGLHITLQEGINLYNAFFKSFPKLRDYERYIDTHLRTFGYAENLFKRKYYGVNTHKAKNYLIQGTGADYTKRLLPELVKLLEGCKSKIQGYLHDEFSFLLHDDEHYLIPKIKTIMEQLEAPIIMQVDIEVSDTTWRDKHDWTNP